MVVGRVAILASETGEGGSDSPERVMPMRLSPGAGGEVVDEAWEAKTWPSVVIWVSRDDCGGGGGSPGETWWHRVVDLSLVTIIDLVSDVYVGAGEWRVQW